MTARNEEIESLRAIAILLTLFQHLPILLACPPGSWEERCWVADLDLSVLAQLAADADRLTPPDPA